MTKLLLLFLTVPLTLGAMFELECFWCLAVGGSLTQVNFPETDQPIYQCLRNRTHATHIFSLHNTSLTKIPNCTWQDLWTPTPISIPNKELSDIKQLLNWTKQALNLKSQENYSESVLVLVQIFLLLLSQFYVVFQVSKIPCCKNCPKLKTYYVESRIPKPRLPQSDQNKSYDEVDG